MGQIELRPLGIGEILDRAVTLFVARFASIVLILAAYTVPIAIVEYIGTPDFAALSGCRALLARAAVFLRSRASS